MKPLKLKKVKISRIGNPHILFGGAEAPDQYPITYTLDTKHDSECVTQTNGTTTTLGNATGIRGRYPVDAADTAATPRN